VTPQGLPGIGAPSDAVAVPEQELLAPGSAPAPVEAKVSADDAWRREVLERVRKRRQVRSHALPLFVEGQPVPLPSEASPSAIEPAPPPTAFSAYRESEPLEEIIEELPDVLENVTPVPASPAPDLLSSLDVPMENTRQGDPRGDLPLRPAEASLPAPVSRARSVDVPSQSLVERTRPTLVSPPNGPRSLVADLPLVEPSRPDPPRPEPAPRPSSAISSRAASMNDRAQAALIDVGMWSAMSVAAFYFASRIARTSILGLGPAWHGLTLFAVVLGAAYILFFGGLSGATPGKIACGIQVRRYDGTSLGPLPSLARGVLGILGIALLGLGIWPAFWDKDRRALHDRATDSRVTIV
jgi:uncharacterized RDD family membrane protein YckC